MVDAVLMGGSTAVFILGVIYCDIEEESYITFVVL